MFDIARGGELDVCTFTRCCCCCCWCEFMWNEHFFFSKGNAETEGRTLRRTFWKNFRLWIKSNKIATHKKNLEAQKEKITRTWTGPLHSTALLSLERKARTLQRARTNNLSFQIGITELRFLWKRPGGGYTNTRTYTHTERESSRKLFILWRTRKRREWVIFKRLGVQKISLARA